MYRVNPKPWQAREGIKVLGPGQHLRREPSDGARRGSTLLDSPSADELPHHRIAAQPVGVVDVCAAGEAREDGLPQEPGETVPTVPAGARIGDERRPDVGRTESVVELAVQQETASRADQ